jgi:hypothetical protein
VEPDIRGKGRIGERGTDRGGGGGQIGRMGWGMFLYFDSVRVVFIIYFRLLAPSFHHCDCLTLSYSLQGSSDNRAVLLA